MLEERAVERDSDGEIASYGYFVVADGTPNGTGNRTQDRSMLKRWRRRLSRTSLAIAENGKPCSAYYQSLETSKIAANGFSCGGLMSQAMVVDSRVTTWGVNSSGMAGANQAYYDMVRTPVLFVEGGPDDIAYDGGAEGYAAIAKLKVPVLWSARTSGTGAICLRRAGATSRRSTSRGSTGGSRTTKR